MVILLSQKISVTKHGDQTDALEHSLSHYLERMKIHFIPVSNSLHDLQYYFSTFLIEGIILSGGNDIDPLSYGKERKNDPDIVPERDRVEKILLEAAVKRKIPLLGICRGMQFINVYFNGKLTHLLSQRIIHLPRQDHPVIIQEFVAELGKEHVVNSYHNYGILKNDLSPELKPFAITSDGIIEGIFNPILPIMGIQWHPERVNQDQTFNDFIVKAFKERKFFWKK